jgi:hypothetical protein
METETREHSDGFGERRDYSNNAGPPVTRHEVTSWLDDPALLVQSKYETSTSQPVDQKPSFDTSRRDKNLLPSLSHQALARLADDWVILGPSDNFGSK